MNGQDLEYFLSTVWAMESNSSQSCISFLWNLYLCHLFFVIWNCFWSNVSFQKGQMTKSTHCVLAKSRAKSRTNYDSTCQTFQKLVWFRNKNTSWDLSLDFEMPAITGHSHYNLIWQQGCFSTDPSKSADISKHFF